MGRTLNVFRRTNYLGEEVALELRVHFTDRTHLDAVLSEEGDTIVLRADVRGSEDRDDIVDDAVNAIDDTWTMRYGDGPNEMRRKVWEKLAREALRSVLR